MAKITVTLSHEVQHGGLQGEAVTGSGTSLQLAIMQREPDVENVWMGPSGCKQELAVMVGCMRSKLANERKRKG